ncbi:MAG: hypothetical protein D6731_20895, partial [Planctomycetota bacterium]
AAPTPSPSDSALAGVTVDASVLRQGPAVSFTGSETLLDAAAASMFPGAEDAQPPPARRAAKSSPLASSALRVLTELQKGIGYFRLYPREHPFCREAVERTHALFAAHHEQFGALAVRIQREGVFLEETLLLPETASLDSLSWLLYPEGIRSLTFERGLTAREVYEFIAALSPQEETELSLGNDLLSTLWRREFAHIQYLTYDQLSPAGLRNVHDPTIADLAARIRELVALSGGDGADDAELQRVLAELPPLPDDGPERWATLPERAESFCESPLGQGRQRLRASLLDAYQGDIFGRAADLVAFGNTHDAYRANPTDEANFMTGMVLNALWQGNLDGAIDLVARAAGGGQLDANEALLERLASEQCLGMLARCLQEQLIARPPAEVRTRGLRYLSRLAPGAADAIARTLSLQVDPEVRTIFAAHLRSRPKESAAAIGRLTLHANRDVAGEALALLAELPGGRKQLEAFARDASEPERAARARDLLGRVTGSFDRQKNLRVVASYPLKKDRLAALEKLRKDTDPSVFAGLAKVAEERAFAKRDADEVDAVLGALVDLGGMRALRVLQGLTERKTMVFGRKDAAKVAAAARKWLGELKRRGS